MFALKPFQENTIAKLKDQFLSLWKSPHDNIPLVFKSPTGSGKTIMMAQFLRDLVGDPRFYGNDVAFIWLTFNEESYIQSKNKLFSYYGGASELDLLDLNDLTRGKMNNNSVFFINWQKIKTSTKEGRKLRQDNEWGLNFDSFINKTKEDGCKLVVIVDEEHIGADTKLADEIFNLIAPKITIRVSATPKYEPSYSDVVELKAGFVEAKRDEVIEAGLIKEKVVFQTEEDLNRQDFKESDQNETLLELAYQKRLDLVEEYKKIGVKVNPLVLIQLPNDDKADKETTTSTMQEIVIEFLKEKGVLENEIAIWLSQDKVNLDDVENNESPVSFLLFKQAAATGWDCPRASVLVMFREIKNPTFAIQTVGRILRMPYGSHFPIPALNFGYLFTNYKRNEVLDEYAKNKGVENRPAIYTSYRKKNVEPIQIESTFMSRTDYNDLGDSFQKTFEEVANKYFGINPKDSSIQAIKKLEAKGLDIKPNLTNELVTGVEIDDYDNFTAELIAEGGSMELKMSGHDIERFYNLHCFNIISKQTDENKKFAPARSWGKLKTALNVWLLKITDLKRTEAYKVILNDLLSASSTFTPVIGSAFEIYRPIREKEVNEKNKRQKRTDILTIPPDEISFTDLYEEQKVKRCAMEPFYLEKDYYKTEKNFIDFLESNKDIIWWYKNGSMGSEFFSIEYHNPDTNKDGLFYPDWIFKTKNNIWFVDTKQGSTAESNETKYKAEALQEWLKNKKGFAGGIAAPDGTVWKVNTNKTYTYSPSFEKWDNLKDII